MQKILGSLRKIDLFAVPISLTYKGEKKFSTRIGGCLSLILLLGFVAYSIVTLYDLINNPYLQENPETLYHSILENTEAYNVTTNNSTLAVLLQGK